MRANRKVPHQLHFRPPHGGGVRAGGINDQSTLLRPSVLLLRLLIHVHAIVSLVVFTIILILVTVALMQAAVVFAALYRRDSRHARPLLRRRAPKHFVQDHALVWREPVIQHVDSAETKTD